MPDQQPQTIDNATPLPDDEIKTLREFFQAVAPGLGRINELVANGWLRPAPNNNLIDSLVCEITQLRAERIVPPINPDMAQSLVNAFAVMSDKLRLSLHRTEKTVQQLRYDAFQAAVETILPPILAKGRLDANIMMQGLIAQDIAEAKRMLGYLEEPVNDQALAIARAQNAEKVRAQIDVLSRHHDLLQQVISGGLTPEQTIERANAQRAQAAAAIVPPGTVLN
jgi:hypothetical protein